MKGIINVTLNFTDGEKTSVEWHGEPGSAFTSKDDLNQFEKALRGFVDKLNKIQGADDPRCKDCKKILHPRFKDQVIYYCKPRMCKACNEFEQKEK